MTREVRGAWGGAPEGRSGGGAPERARDGSGTRAHFLVKSADHVG